MTLLPIGNFIDRADIVWIAVKAVSSVEDCFRKNLFDKKVLKGYIDSHAVSEPYKHAVIHNLMNNSLLRAVRDEIRENVQFTPKETDIYRIHQSGDLANLDGLDGDELAKLPSLLKLRDALYSPEFRNYASTITGSGPLSGKNTDLAINIYTPGCHLLCHDDVIGSRKISYILYLTDPDIKWKEEWGGALRLFPTEKFKDEDDEETIVASPDVSKIIPPAWNQLSFFAVQPGLSFHDVEEVYHAESKEQLKKDGGRIRMAISGWFHIPQIGEEGYVEGAEEEQVKKSSLMQLQGKPDQYDFPKEEPVSVEDEPNATDEPGLEAADIDFLLKYMAPGYLTPDTMDQVADHFEEESSATLDGLLSPKFADRVREFIEKQEANPLDYKGYREFESSSLWRVARPPHKHRFFYMQPTSQDAKEESFEDPIQELINVFLPSPQFRKWLKVATSCDIESHSVLARRFRRGSDYALATSHEGDPKLEVSLGLTPTPGWGGNDDENEDEDTDAGEASTNGKAKAQAKANRRAEALEKQVEQEDEYDDDVGGHEAYLAGDEDADDDAATYKASTSDEDNVLFTMPACWNKMSIVLRDSGVLKFVKYVSKNAKGDRWDVTGTYGVKNIEDEEEEGGEGEATGADAELDSAQVILESSGDEDTFNGFPESEDSDSE